MLQSVASERARNVKRRRHGQMALRWCAADVAEASKQFRRVNGHLHRPEPHRHVGYDNVEPDGNIQGVSGA